MTQQESEGKGQAKETGASLFPNLAMNEIASSATQEASEAPRRAGAMWLVLIVILVAVAALGFGMRQMLNVAPGTEAQQRLLTRVQALPAWQSGMVLGANYVAGDRLRVDFSPTLEADAATLRKATIEVMKEFMKERPNRDLYIDGFQGEKQVVTGQYRNKGMIEVAGGGLEPDITVRVAGEPEGGIGQLVKPEGARQ
jgi:hypothetical protein